MSSSRETKGSRAVTQYHWMTDNQSSIQLRNIDHSKNSKDSSESKTYKEPLYITLGFSFFKQKRIKYPRR